MPLPVLCKYFGVILDRVVVIFLHHCQAINRREQADVMAIQVVEFSREEYTIRKVFS
jgi:hypothetical protein